MTLRGPARVAAAGAALLAIGIAMTIENRIAMASLLERLESDKFRRIVEERSGMPFSKSYPAVHVVRTWATVPSQSGLASALGVAGMGLLLSGGVG